MLRPVMLVAVACAMIGAGAPLARAAEPTKVADLLAKTPAATIAEGSALAAELVALGPAAVKEVAAMVVPSTKGGDAKARFALGGLAFHVARPGAEAERKMVAAAMAEALEAAKESEVRSFLCSLLQLCGGDEAVPALARLLPDADLCVPAAMALERIGTPAAAGALVESLASAKAGDAGAVVRGVGVLRAKAAVPHLLAMAKRADGQVRRLVLYALANIGDPAAGDVLAEAARTEAKEQRAHATALYLLFARRLAEGGDKTACAAICRALMKSRTDPRENNVVAAALATLADAVGDAAAPDLLAALDSPNAQLRAAAMALAEKVPGEAMSARLVEKCRALPPDAAADIIRCLGRRDDPKARAAVLAAARTGEPPVRQAAVEALVRQPGPAAVQVLLAALQTGSAAEVQTIERTLLRMPGDGVADAAAENLPKAPPAARPALLRVLASRGNKAHVGAVFAAAGDKDAAVAVAAVNALADLAAAADVPRLVKMMDRPMEDNQAQAFQKALAAICLRTPDAQARAEPILAALAAASQGVRPLLLTPLARLGGPKALAAVVAETKAADTAMQDAAVRALADWPDAEAAPALLAIAETSANATHPVIALRGYLRLAGLPSDRPAARTVAMYQQALAAAKRPDEKRQALAGLAAMRGGEALRAVAAYLDDAALAAEAALAAVRIVLPQKDGDKPLTGDDVMAVMKKVAESAKDKTVREQAQAYVASAPRPAEANLALGRPVSISAEAQGDQKPELAVDGNWIDPYSSYWGDRWPSWFQVDLGKPTRIDTVRIYFWWDSRYYQYTVEVSADAKSWQPVADQGKNTKPSTPAGTTHTFPPVEARYVRVTILKNSANEAVHIVELQVFAPGTAPKEQAAPAPAPLAPADAEGFHPLFNGKDLAGWIGATKGYVAENGVLVCLKEGGGNLYVGREFSDFHLKFEFKLTSGANNGLGIRTPTGVDAAYAGMELQILDDSADVYKNLQPYQYHGSIYGVAPCERGHQKPVGEWNAQEVVADGPKIKVILNGATIVDADLSKIEKTADGHPHPGLHNAAGHIGFLGHGSRVEFRSIRIKELTK